MELDSWGYFGPYSSMGWSDCNDNDVHLLKYKGLGWSRDWLSPREFFVHMGAVILQLPHVGNHMGQNRSFSSFASLFFFSGILPQLLLSMAMCKAKCSWVKFMVKFLDLHCSFSVSWVETPEFVSFLSIFLLYSQPHRRGVSTVCPDLPGALAFCHFQSSLGRLRKIEWKVATVEPWGAALCRFRGGFVAPSRVECEVPMLQ